MRKAILQATISKSRPKGEVYSRVVGYLRPVQGGNKGKREEFKLRAKFCAECGERGK